MRRFFFQPEERDGQKVILSEAESKHMKIVLRLQVGDVLELMDGSGAIYSGRIAEITKRVIVEITGELETVVEEKTSLWVGQGMIKSKNMDLIVQKCTELGVDRFTPFISSRCQGRIDAPQLRKKVERWQRISDEACKQCGRSRQMEISFPVDLENLLTEESDAECEQKLFFWEEEREQSVQDLSPLSDNDRIWILLGPEGGITEGEAELAKRTGWQSLSLGRRILRAETAAIASVSIIQHRLGYM